MTARPNPVLLDSGWQVRVVDEVTASAPLGVRFWDWALSRPVREGLVVRARPRNGGPITTARPSSSGVYGFLSLPTTREAERGALEEFPAPAAYALGVWDTLGRYVPMRISVSAPVAGVQPAPNTLPPVDGSSPDIPGFYLFAAATRPVPPGYLAVRLDLRDEELPVAGVEDTFQPARHVLVEATVEGETSYGVSDADGRVLVLAPTPPMAPPADGTGPSDLSARRWDVELRLNYERLAAEEFPGVPDFADIADQAEATATYPGGEAASTTATVTYGEDLVVTSPQRSDLLVKPA
jgi:hypothetical protein